MQRTFLILVVGLFQVLLASCVADVYQADYDPAVETQELLEEEAVRSLYDQIELDPSSLAGPTFGSYHSPFATGRDPDEQLGYRISRVYCGEAAREAVVREVEHLMCGRSYLTGDRLECVTSGGCWGRLHSVFERDEDGRWTLLTSSFISDSCGVDRHIQATLGQEMLDNLDSAECGTEPSTDTQYIRLETLEKMGLDWLATNPDVGLLCD